MQVDNTFVIVVSILLLSVLPQPVGALTFDYQTTAQALAEVGWYDYLGLVWDSDYDTKEAENARSYATAYYDEIMFMGNVGASALTDASVEPNEVVLSAEVAGSYEFDIGWELMEYFFQDANGTAEGLLRIGEFPAGAPCRLKIDISFPNETWNGQWIWQLYIESSSDYFVAGRDELGDYGKHSGTINACAGEEIYVFLAIAGRGYADHQAEALGYGTLTINAILKAVPHVADLTADGWIDFKDFAVFSSHWSRQDCEDPNTNWCGGADFDHSGMVDVNDLELFTQYWLYVPTDPNKIDFQSDLAYTSDKSTNLTPRPNVSTEPQNSGLPVNLPEADRKALSYSRPRWSSIMPGLPIAF
ncbi:MAG: hypothetical protein ACYSUX_04235 [Planctomycetota bacterium]|jgi:hypothetical protein